MNPKFSGVAIFGDPNQFTASVFAGGALDEDAFLGLPAGTTKYSPCERGPAIAITGVLNGLDQPTVAAAQAALQAAANGQTGSLLVPTGAMALGSWDIWHNAWATPADLVFSAAGIVPAATGGGYQLAYAIIFRNVNLFQ
jgi:hypothetical protein